MNGSGSKGTVTVNYGSGRGATMGSQPKEAAWIAYTNGDASLNGTPPFSLFIPA